MFAKLPAFDRAVIPLVSIIEYVGTNYVLLVSFGFLKVFFSWVEVRKELVELLLVLPEVHLEIKGAFR